MTTSYDSLILLAISCAECLDRGLANHDLLDLDEFWFDNQVLRFRSWCATLGVNDRGHDSLEHRLRYSPEIEAVIFQLLTAIKVGFQDASQLSSSIQDKDPTQLVLSLVQSTSQDDGAVREAPTDESSSSQSSDSSSWQATSSPRNPPSIAEQISDALSQIEDAITTLHELVVLVREPGAPVKSDQAVHFIPRDVNGNDLTPHFEAYARVAMRRGLSKTSLSQRMEDLLLASVVRRWRCINYCRDKHLGAVSGAQGEEEDLSQESSGDHEKPLRREGSGIHLSRPASQAEIDPELPPPPSINGDSFECPYCCVVCPATDRENTKWREHLMQDLEPYICTFKACPLDDTFRTIADWIAHIQAEHLPRRWICNACPYVYITEDVAEASTALRVDQYFSEELLYKKHVREQHSNSYSDDQLSVLARTSVLYQSDVFVACPFCDYSELNLLGVPDEPGGKQLALREHVTTHMQSLALISIPWHANTSSKPAGNSQKIMTPEQGRLTAEFPSSGGPVSFSEEVGRGTDVESSVDSVASTILSLSLAPSYTHTSASSFTTYSSHPSSLAGDEETWEAAADKSLETGDFQNLPPLLRQHLEQAMKSHMPEKQASSELPIETALEGIRTAYSAPGKLTVHKGPPLPTAMEIMSREATSENASPGIFTGTSTMPEASRRQGTARPQDAIVETAETSPTSTLDNSFACGSCSKADVKLYYCMPCSMVYCEDCWDDSFLHRRQHSRNSDNEKIDPALALKIHEVLDSSRQPEEQALLHVRDEETTWFAIAREPHRDMVLRDFGRFSVLMAERSAHRRDECFPALVSFGGQTGTGKSSLVRLLIDIHVGSGPRFQVPVVGSIANPHQATSGDVHLYADPVTFEETQPILYADCEGLDSGELVPTGKMASTKSKVTVETDASSSTKRTRRQSGTREREILWANSDKTRSREYQVQQIYPRLLFMVSDVIVFVLKNPRALHAAIEKLIDWARAALENSVNQPVLPHAIIVLNALPHDSDPKLWDVDSSTANIIDSFRSLMDSGKVQKHVQHWRSRGIRVDNIDSLLSMYYAGFRVVRVPGNGAPNLIHRQIQTLHSEIRKLCTASQTARHRVRMQLNSDELQPYFQHVFDHVCRQPQMPFDFSAVSNLTIGASSDFASDIVKIAVTIKDLWKAQLTAERIFTKLSSLVASCILLDVVRSCWSGSADVVFRRYIDQCSEALQRFCTQHWPCEYVFPDTQTRCVNVEAGHSHGHQQASGRVYAIGPYESSLNWAFYDGPWRESIYRQFSILLAEYQDRDTSDLAVVHRDKVLIPFIKDMTPTGSQTADANAFISFTTCFCCLMNSPRHVLPCGHVLCTPCVQGFGVRQDSGSSLIEMSACPLHQEESDQWFQKPWCILTKPRMAGVRILSLDGGGARAVIELTILEQLERELGPGLYLKDFFDLIVGSGMGGIVALGLGIEGLTVQACRDRFVHFCRKAFQRKDFVPAKSDSIITLHDYTRYATKPVESALKDIFGEKLLIGGSADVAHDSTTGHSTKVAVTTTTTAGTAVILANYFRKDMKGLPYQFYRVEDSSMNIKIWEAARATSASPVMFAPIDLPSGQAYQDGSICYNCPIEVAWQEQRLIWPDTREDFPDLVLSIGSGVSRRDLQKRIPISKNPSSLFFRARTLARIALDHVQATLSCERIWQNFVEHNEPPENRRDRYVRLNLKLDRDLPMLDDVSAMTELEEMTRRQFAGLKDSVRLLADQLLATAFYLDHDEVAQQLHHRDGSVTISGHINCRLSAASTKIRSLGASLETRVRRARDAQSPFQHLYFLIHEKGSEDKAKKIMLDAQKLHRMSTSGFFLPEEVQFTLSDRRAEMGISLCLGFKSDVELHPISGFPRCLTLRDPFESYPSPAYKGPSNTSVKEMFETTQQNATASENVENRKPILRVFPPSQHELPVAYSGSLPDPQREQLRRWFLWLLLPTFDPLHAHISPVLNDSEAQGEESEQSSPMEAHDLASRLERISTLHDLHRPQMFGFTLGHPARALPGVYELEVPSLH